MKNRLVFLFTMLFTPAFSQSFLLQNNENAVGLSFGLMRDVKSIAKGFEADIDLIFKGNIDVGFSYARSFSDVHYHLYSTFHGYHLIEETGTLTMTAYAPSIEYEYKFKAVYPMGISLGVMAGGGSMKPDSPLEANLPQGSVSMYAIEARHHTDFNAKFMEIVLLFGVEYDNSSIKFTYPSTFEDSTAKIEGWAFPVGLSLYRRISDNFGMALTPIYSHHYYYEESAVGIFLHSLFYSKDPFKNENE